MIKHFTTSITAIYGSNSVDLKRETDIIVNNIREKEITNLLKVFNELIKKKKNEM